MSCPTLIFPVIASNAPEIATPAYTKEFTNLVAGNAIAEINIAF